MSTLNLGNIVNISGTNRRITGILQAEGIIPTGAVIFTAASTGIAPNHTGFVPPGYLPCDGAQYSLAAYPELYAAIRDIFSTGSYATSLINPSTGIALPPPDPGYFRVPQLQGEFIRCWDGPIYTSYDPTVSGRRFGSYQVDTFQSFTGDINAGPNAAAIIASSGAFTNIGNRGYIATGPSSSGWPTTVRFDPASGGARTSTETRPRNIALLAIIKY